ncbi:MAG TPA: UvrD-helicase domain-containing protein, partial [Candidatus Acidoferrum sp.]|nr:UvrD-helicase domain-containing protein [Candidatus Acidoferrum sp.]
VDFADMIEICLRDHKIGPGDPQVIFIDEAQDMAPLLVALVRQWGKHALLTMLFGDDDQTIYGWLGANPDVLVGDNLPDSQKIVLPQGYRMARAVHDYSQRFIAQIRNRQHKIFAPRAEGGSVEYLPEIWKEPWFITETAEKETAAGSTVQILASCGYMLKPTIDELRARGLPFHNPYRPENGSWNPVRSGGGSAVERLSAWLKPLERPWTVEELWLAVEPLDTKKVLRRGAKAAIERNAQERPQETVTHSHLTELFEPGILAEIHRAGEDETGRGLIEWWEEHLLTSKREKLAYPLEIVRKRGLAALRERPKIIVGSIHSIKGTTTDTVIVFPDLSPQFYELLFQRGGQDALVRLFYVAISRARERVYLCRPASQAAIDWIRL